MRLYLLVLPVTLLLLWPASGQEITAIPIPVFNGGFEVDDLFCTPGNDCYAFGGTGWIAGPASGVIKPSTIQFPSGVPGGANVAWIGGFNSTGSILQVLSVPVRANVTYTLTLSVGQRADKAFTGYIAALTAGDAILAADSSLSPAPGTFLQDVIVYKSGPNPPQLGKLLAIFIKSLGNGQVNIDNVALAATVD